MWKSVENFQGNCEIMKNQIFQFGKSFKEIFSTQAQNENSMKVLKIMEYK
jgi:hypothetical protein